MTGYENKTDTALSQGINKNINISAALSAFSKLHRAYNNSRPEKEIVRKMKNGQLKTIRLKEGAIKKSVIETGEKLILQYVKVFNEMKKLGFTEQPSLSTNSVELSRLFSTSDRTIRNHIKLLQAPGLKLISTYISHGPRANYELWINPEILWPEQNENSKKAALAPAPPALSEEFSAIKQPETPETIEKEITHVDKCGAAMQQCALPVGEGETCDTFTSDTGLQLSGSRLRKKVYGSVDAKKQDTEAGGAARVKKDAQMAVFKTYVENFWAIACKLLYPTADWSEYHHRMAKNAIFYGVYRGFKKQLSSEIMEEYHLQMIERLKLAANYYENHPEKHPPMPYAEFKPGTGYFDAENERGFSKTYDWLIKQQVWKKQQKVNDALRRAEKEIRLHKKGKLKAELQKKTPLEMFRYQESRLKRFGRAALDKFYAQYSPTIPNS